MSLEPRDRCKRLWSFIICEKNMSNKYSQKLLDSTKKFTTDAMKLLQK